MQTSGTLKSIQDFSNFFDQQLFVHDNASGYFYAVKNGSQKQIKFPAHLSKLLSDKTCFSKAMLNGTEKTVLHIFRLGDGFTLFLSDPGTGTVLNSFILSLITLSSNVCSVSPVTEENNINQVLLDQLVAEFDKEKTKFAVTDKRQKEEIIILEEQAKEAFNQLDETARKLNEKNAENEKLKKQLSELAESYKIMDKKLNDSQFTSDFKIGAELKKKNELLRDNNKKLVEMVKRSSTALNDLHSEIEMCIKDLFETTGISNEIAEETMNSVNELFASYKNSMTD
jgi:hypothetical protein